LHTNQFVLSPTSDATRVETPSSAIRTIHAPCR